jgi:hypothetical protein
MRHPTFFLGLGQEGTRVLSQLRRSLARHESHGIASSFAAMGLGELPDEDRELWSAGEFLPIEPHRVTDILLDIDRRVGDEPSWRQTLAWPPGIDPITLRDAIEVPGSRRSRLLGRLSLLTEQFAVERHLKRAISRLRAQTGGCDRPLSIFLVASISGGSGSGMLLDVAHLVRQFEPRSFRSLFLLLPNHAHEDVQARRLRGVAHATLTELAAARHEDLSDFMRPWNLRLTGRERELFGRCFLFGAPEHTGSPQLLARTLVGLSHGLVRELVSRFTDSGTFDSSLDKPGRTRACFSQCGTTWIDALPIEPLGDSVLSALLVALQQLCQVPSEAEASSDSSASEVAATLRVETKDARPLPRECFREKALELARELAEEAKQPIGEGAKDLLGFLSRRFSRRHLAPIRRVRGWIEPIAANFSQGWTLKASNLQTDSKFQARVEALATLCPIPPEQGRELLTELQRAASEPVDSSELGEYHRKRLQRLLSPPWWTFKGTTGGFQKEACEILSWWLALPTTTEALATALQVAAIGGHVLPSAAGASEPAAAASNGPTSEPTPRPEKPPFSSPLPADAVAALRAYLEDHGRELRKWFTEVQETEIANLVADLRSQVSRDQRLAQWLRANARFVLDHSGGWAQRLRHELLCQAQEACFTHASAQNPELVIFVVPRGLLWPKGQEGLEDFLRALGEAPANSSKRVVIEWSEGPRLWCYRERLFHPLEALANLQSYQQSFAENPEAALFPQLLGSTSTEESP